MFPVAEIGIAILRMIPMLLVDPRMAIVFWLVVILVGIQYRRLALLEQSLYGVAKNSPVAQTVGAVVQGIAGGVFGSFLLVLLGVTVAGLGAGYLLLVALLLMTIHPRFMCFSYAGGLISISSLLFGFPDVNVPAVIALVAVLHVVESFLILFTGHLGATPMNIKNNAGKTVGGFALQRFWPVPVILLVLVGLPNGELPPGSINMPDWWPLIKPEEALPEAENILYVMFPVAAALGYSDVAVTCRPREKTLRSSLWLAAYSVSLLVVGVLSSAGWIYQFLAAVYAALGHEAVVLLGRRGQMDGRPYFTAPQQGVRVMDLVPGAPAERAGLGKGDVVVEVNGEEVGGPAHLTQLLAEAGGTAWLTVRRNGKPQAHRLVGKGRTLLDFGFIPVPSEDAQNYVEFRHQGFFQRLLGRLTNRGRNGG